MPLPTIKVECAECGKPFECQPDDALGFGKDQPFYLCPECEERILSLMDEDDQLKGGDPHS